MNMVKTFVLPALLVLLMASLVGAQTVDVYGQVRFFDGTCSTGEGLNGVTVMLYDTSSFYESTVTYTDSAFMIAHNLSSPDGIYYFDDVPYSLAYTVEIIPPDGVVLAVNPYQGSWWNANPRAVGDDFYRCFLLLPESHTVGFWGAQARKAVTGKGNAQIPADELQDIYDAIFDQFDGATFFPIEGVSSVSGSPLTPQDALNTFNATNGGPNGMVNKAKKQLLALLCDVGAGFLPLDQIISEDDRTVTEAIAFAADMITNSGAEIGTAKDACDYINNNLIVPPGWIPDDYGSIVYGTLIESFAQALPSAAVLAGNYPNPFNPETAINFNLPQASHVTLIVYNLQGQRLAELVSGHLESGQHAAHWNASGYPSGAYIYRLSTDYGDAVGKMVLMK